MEKILIIQDSPSINALFGSILEPAGFLLDIAKTGEEGIEKAKTGQYQLILLDYRLPGINGLEVCRILRKEKNSQCTPIVFISARSEDELKELAEETGADGYICEPFEAKELIEKVRGFIKCRK